MLSAYELVAERGMTVGQGLMRLPLTLKWRAEV
jgi:hypothetical protein